MNLLINSTNIVKGGGIQVTLSFLNELKSHPENQYTVILSHILKDIVDIETFPNNFQFIFFDKTISKKPFFNSSIKKLNQIENDYKPDLIFTVFGPAYWTPQHTPHISGYAAGWAYLPIKEAYKKLSLSNKIKVKIKNWIKNKEIKKANELIVETETAKKHIINKIGFREDKIHVVGNTYHQIYEEKWAQQGKEDKALFNLITISSYYSHKNLEIINKVVKELKKREIQDVRFYLTLPNEVFEKNFIKSNFIKNLGVLKIEDCPKWYNFSDALFLPTLLETFTASYPEAMVMKKPILTSDLDFAHELCSSAALYFDPNNEIDIVNKIIKLKDNQDLYQNLIKNGQKQLSLFETSKSRTQKYLDIFQNIIKNKRNETNHTII